jgi:hypothetical protein
MGVPVGPIYTPGRDDWLEGHPQAPSVLIPGRPRRPRHRAVLPHQAVNVPSRTYLSPMRQGLIAVGLVLVVLGLTWPWFGRIGLGHLPGDIRLRWPGVAFYFPLGSSLLVSIVLSLVLALVLWLFRR